MTGNSFTKVKIGTLEIPNRFLMSAAVDGLAKNPQARAQRYAALAEGGVGIIVAGRVLDEKENFGTVVEAVHRAGGKIALQILSHHGIGFHPNQDAPAASVISKESHLFNGFTPWGPHHEASLQEIAAIAEEFRAAARLAKSFGVDAVQMHSAHSSALMQYLTPLINRRADRYGGPIENRVRIHQEVYDAVRAEVGSAMPVFIKLGVCDVIPGGLTLEEGVAAAKMLADYGYDAIEVSQGWQDFSDPKTYAGTPLRTHIARPEQEAYFRNWAREVKKVVRKPVILTGGIRSFEVVEDILAKGDADLVGMCRPFIREPGLVRRWANGDRAKATCVSCNKCGELLGKAKPLACVLEEK